MLSIEGISEIEVALRKAGWGVVEFRSATVGPGFAALGYTDGYIERNTSIWDIVAATAEVHAVVDPYYRGH